MRNCSKIIAGIVLMALGAACLPQAAVASLPEFEYYKIILERKPFGEIAPSAVGALSADAAMGSFAKDIELRAIVDEDNQIRVGLYDKQANRGFYVALGQTVNNIELISADYDAEEAILRKGAETLVFKLRPDQPASTPGTRSMDTLAALAPPSVPSAASLTPAPITPSGSPAARRPFFAEMRRRRPPRRSDTASNTNESGFPGFFKPAGQAPTNLPSNLGPFTPVAGTNFGPMPFSAPPAVAAGSDAASSAPFSPFAPAAMAPAIEGDAAAQEQYLIQQQMQQQEDGLGLFFQPSDAVPFQFYQE